MAKFILSAFSDEAAADLKGQIEALKRNGIHNTEIRNVDKKNIIEHDINSLKEIKKQLDDEGIGISAIGSPIGKIGINDKFAKHIDDFKKAMETAQILGTKRIRMFSFFIPKGENADDYKDVVYKRMDSLISLAQKEGIYCCHENEKEIYGDIKRRCHELHEHFKGRLNGIFDPANYIQCGEKPTEIFDDLFPFIDYLHIKDAVFSDGSVVPSGHGDGGIKELIEKFSQKEGDRFLTLEPHLSVFEGFANLKDNSLKHKYSYPSQGESFDAAVLALKEILNNGGYIYE